MSLSRGKSAPRRLDAFAVFDTATTAAVAAAADDSGHPARTPAVQLPRFASVRLDAITHPDLIPRDRDVLAYLDSRAAGDVWVVVKIADIARFLDTAWRTVQRSLQRLKAAGLLIRRARFVTHDSGQRRRVCDRYRLIGRRHKRMAPDSAPARPKDQPVPARVPVAMTPVTGDKGRGKHTRPTGRLELPERVRARLERYGLPHPPD